MLYATQSSLFTRRFLPLEFWYELNQICRYYKGMLLLTYVEMMGSDLLKQRRYRWLIRSILIPFCCGVFTSGKKELWSHVTCLLSTYVECLSCVLMWYDLLMICALVW